MADNETSYLPIGTCLEQIEKAVYGREVRKAIHDGIAQCYDDTVEGVNAAQQAASDTQDVIDNAVTATNAANTAAAEASNVKVEQTVSGDTVTFTTTKRDGTTVSTSFQKPNIVVSKDEGSGEFSVTGVGWNGEEITAKIPDPSEEVKSRANIAAVSKVKTALGNPLTITDGMDAPAVKTVVTLEPKQDLHGYDHPWVGGSGKNLLPIKDSVTISNITFTKDANGYVTASPSNSDPRQQGYLAAQCKFHLTAGAYKLIADVSVAATNSNNTLVLYDDSNNQISLTAGYNIFTNAGLKVRDFLLDNDANVGLLFKIYDGSARFMIVKSTETDYTYSPYSNICPIEGYDTVRVTATGKNLADFVQNMGIRQDGTIAAHDGRIATVNPISIKSGSQYRFVSSNDSILGLLSVFKGDTLVRRISAITSNIILNTSGGDRFYFCCYNGDTNITSIEAAKAMIIESSETDMSYEPFGSTTSLSVAQAAGATVYGGTVTLNEDGSGTLVVDKQYLKGSECTWSVNTNYANTFNGQHTYGLSVPSDTTGYSSAYVMYDSGKVAQYDYGFAHANAGRTLYVKDKDYSDLASFQAHIADVEFVYNLATPSNPIQLTADQLRTLTGENHVWTDGTKLELTYRADKYADVEKFLNAIPTGTKTGDPAVFADGADDLPFEKLTIAVEPHQEGSGDPSPDNVRPITGWDEVKVTRCGKNVAYDVEYGSSAIQYASMIKASYTLIKGKRYVLSFDTPNTGVQVYRQNQSDIGFANTFGFSFELDGKRKSFWGIAEKSATYSNKSVILKRLAGDVASGLCSNFMIEMVDDNVTDPSTYEPFADYTILPISLKYATGSTVYGGTVTINRDGTGSVVVDRAKVDMGTLAWTYQTSATIQLFRASVTGIKTGGSDMAKLSCPIYKWVPTSQRTNNTISQNYSTNVDVMDSRYTDAASFKAAMSGIPLIYEFATPTTYTLTAPQLTSLLGNNTVWCDAGQVTVKYKRDIGKALDAMVASLIEAGLYVDMGGVDVAPGA